MEATNIFKTKPKEQKTGIKKSFPVTGMTCAACASSVESILSHTDGVNKAIVNFASNSVLVDYDETISEEKLQKIISQNFDLRPQSIIESLNLLRPIYKKTAAYGHFGRTDKDFTWEKTGIL